MSVVNSDPEMQQLVTEEWATNEEIYSSYLHNARGEPDGKRLVVTTFGYVKMLLPGLEAVREAWAGACKLNGKYGHVEKHLIKEITEVKPKEVEMYLSQSPCAECSDSLLDLVTSTNIKLQIYFTSVYLHNRSREARALARLARHPMVDIGTWSREQWDILTSKLGMTHAQVIEDPERDHWDGEWAAVTREILLEEITADPVSGDRLTFYKPRNYRGNDGLLNSMDRLNFS